MITKKRNPYRKGLGNVYVRRLFGIFVSPLIFVFWAIPGIAINAWKKEIPYLIKEYLNAMKDGESYD